MSENQVKSILSKKRKENNKIENSEDKITLSENTESNKRNFQ